MLIFLNLRNSVGIIGFPKNICYHFNVLTFDSVYYKIGLFDIIEQVFLLEFRDYIHGSSNFEIIVL
jgi:hypothetical protein